VNWKILKNGGFKMPEIQEEEIDLREYINVLLKRKNVIILIFLIAVITAAIVSYSIISPSPIYKSSVTFSMAQVNDQAIININESLEIMKSTVLLNKVINRMDLEIDNGQLKPQIEVKNIKGTNFIEISVLDNSPEKAKNLAENITEVFIDQNQGKYLEKRKLVEDRLKALEEQIVELEKNIEEINKAKEKIAASKELSVGERQFQISLLLNSLVAERKLYNDLSNRANSLEASLKDCEDFKIINYTQLTITPPETNKKLNIAIAGVLGLFIGIFVAFFLEFWQKGKS
jgi:capsular polysaccharide biosynthesis protein